MKNNIIIFYISFIFSSIIFYFSLFDLFFYSKTFRESLIFSSFITVYSFFCIVFEKKLSNFFLRKFTKKHIKNFQKFFEMMSI